MPHNPARAELVRAFCSEPLALCWGSLRGWVVQGTVHPRVGPVMALLLPLPPSLGKHTLAFDGPSAVLPLPAGLRVPHQVENAMSCRGCKPRMLHGVVMSILERWEVEQSMPLSWL